MRFVPFSLQVGKRAFFFVTYVPPSCLLLDFLFCSFFVEVSLRMVFGSFLFKPCPPFVDDDLFSFCLLDAICSFWILLLFSFSFV
ncbi:hypothetical protein DsansV1_C28g0205591 [Dioscorea sansibarensis]